MVQVVRQKLLALAAAHAVNVGAVPQNAVRIQGGKGAAHDDRDLRRLGLELPGHALDRRVGGGREEGERNHVGPFLCGRPGDVLRLHLRVAGVKHPHLVSPLAQDRRERLDPQRRKRHHFDPPVVRLRPVQRRRQHAAKVIVANVNQKHIHEMELFREAYWGRLTATPGIAANGFIPSHIRDSV